MSDGNGMSFAISTLGDGARSELGQDRMRPRYKVSQAGVDLIEAFEGLRPKAARLDDGRWTVGYGHTRSAREDAEVSREDALILLRWVDLPPVEEAINALVSAPLTQNQYDALVAFVFNVGIDAFADSEVLEHLNADRPTEAACALELWRKADIAGDPVVLDALIRRRAAEKALFLTPRDGVAPTPTPSPLVRPRPDARAAQFVPARRPAEVEAPMAGERAEVRLVVPYEIEPEPEAPTALAPARSEAEPEPAPEPLSESAPEAEAPTAGAVEAAEPDVVEAPEGAAAPVELLATWSTWTAWAGRVAEAVANESEPEAAPERVEAPEEAPTAWTADAVANESEPAAAPERVEALEEAPTAWTAEAVADPEPEAEPEPAADRAGAEASLVEAADEATPHEEAQIASTAEAEEAGAQDAAPTVWSIELPHAISDEPEEPAPTAWTVEPAETDWDEPAPSSWIVGVTPPAAPAVETSPIAVAAEPPAAEPAAEPQADAAAEVETATGAEAAPAAPEPEEMVRDVPASGAVLQTRALPETAPRPRPLYSSYGPMAFAVAPPPSKPAAPAASAVEPSRAALEEVAVGGGFAIAERAAKAAAPAEPQAVQIQPPRTPTFPKPAFQPLPELTVPTAALEPAQPVRSFAPPVPAEARAPATASAPAVTAAAAPAKPLVLTSPPADWEEPRATSTKASLAAETDELETPLFDEGWDGPGALSGRIVHHEAPVEHDARATRLRVTGPYVLLGFIGFVAFGGALFAFSRGRAASAGAGNPVVLAWILALIGAACVGISVYFLLKRLGGQED